MSIPSETDFADFLALGDGGLPLGYTEPREIAEGGFSELEAFLRRASAEREDLGERLQQSVVGVWLQSNSTSSRAWRALHGKDNRSVPFDAERHARFMLDLAERERTEEDFERERLSPYGDTAALNLETYLLEANSLERRRQRLSTFIRRFCEFKPWGAFHGVAGAFDGYFYKDSFRRYCVKSGDRQGAARQLIASIRALHDQALWDQAGVQPAPLRTLDRALRHLETASTVEGNPPIQKIDGTAPERGLAFEMWSLFRRTYRRNKASAIFNFMQFDGVKSPPDVRSIERWVADWSRRKVGLARQ